LPVCDEVVVCDGESDDGTQEFIREWMLREPKIKLCVYKWPDPVGQIDFWVDWLNFARTHIKTDYQLQLDADEVLHESSYPTILKLKERNARFSVRCQRYNFWRDAQHLIPHGVCCSHLVTRIAPQNVWLPSDGPHPNGQEAIMMAIDPPEQIEIYHYGFLRKPDAFFKKAKAIQKMFFNSYDPRLAKAETMAGNWMENCEVGWENNLLPFNKPHPQRMIGWLQERGYKV